MWSLGIVTFILLTGFPPFKSNDLKDIYRTIITDNIRFEQRIWKNKTDLALSFVKNCLSYDPNYRMTPDQGLNHPWITQLKEEGSSIDVKLYGK